MTSGIITNHLGPSHKIWIPAGWRSNSASRWSRNKVSAWLYECSRLRSLLDAVINCFIIFPCDSLLDAISIMTSDVFRSRFKFRSIHSVRCIQPEHAAILDPPTPWLQELSVVCDLVEAESLFLIGWALPCTCSSWIYHCMHLQLGLVMTRDWLAARFYGPSHVLVTVKPVIYYSRRFVTQCCDGNAFFH